MTVPLIFKDHFSAQANEYAKFRPPYPDELFQYLAGVCSTREMAWDCATGNGQRAASLARYFDSVIATDASEKQLKNAELNSRVEYRVASAEASGLRAHSIDLVTVAQALHWFEIESFWKEAHRTLKPNGVIAIWCYELLAIPPEIDATLNHFYRDIVGRHWSPERKLVETGYRSLQFPFLEPEKPAFAMEASWSLEDLTGYLRTWSATQKFIEENGADPVKIISPLLQGAWGDWARPRHVTWPLHLRVGRNIGAL
jgi:ubiquinone/menaquinone biosynthesis C-methylase UbiE